MKRTSSAGITSHKTNRAAESTSPSTTARAAATMVAAYFHHDANGAMPFQPYMGVEAHQNQTTDQPTHTDVLLGRGVATNRHPGNQNFRHIVSKHVDVYVVSTKKQKMMISRSIVDKVRTELCPPGRFLEKDAQTGLWHEVDDKRALEKTAQALRDGAAPLRKQLTEDMQDPSFLKLFDGKAGKSSEKVASQTKKAKRRHSRKISESSIADVMSSSFDPPPPAQKKHRSNPEIAMHHAVHHNPPQPNAIWPTLYPHPQTHPAAAMPNAPPYEPALAHGDPYLGQSVPAPVQVDAQHAFFDPSATGAGVPVGYSLNNGSFTNEDLLKMALLLGGNL